MFQDYLGSIAYSQEWGNNPGMYKFGKLNVALLDARYNKFVRENVFRSDVFFYHFKGSAKTKELLKSPIGQAMKERIYG